jgi:hypothetical protein
MRDSHQLLMLSTEENMSSRRSFQWPWSPAIPQDSPSLYSNHERKSSSTLSDAVWYYSECNLYDLATRYSLAHSCTDSEFLHPRPPPLPPPAYTTFDPTNEVSAIEAVLTRIDEHRQIVQTADRLGYTPQSSVSKRRWKPLLAALLAMNLCAMSLIVVAVYMGVMSNDPLWKNAFWCGFTNSLPKSLVSGAFVFTVAIVGMTPFAQRYLKGVWTMLLYSFFLFMMGSIIGAANHSLNIVVVVCKA